MCGITGFWQRKKIPDDKIIKMMSDQITSRGPDDSGQYVRMEENLALGHRRLAVIDLSRAGSQPMISPCGRYVLTYNGEIYNHFELRKELEVDGGAFNWRGHSDTETLLASLRHWGLERTLGKLNGMFAFALWDDVERKLFLARDRAGEKPLYYGQTQGAFVFGSELKSIEKHPDWKGEINRDALALYLRHNYVPSPWTIYKGIFKLPPAHFLVVQENGRVIGEPKSYWGLSSESINRFNNSEMSETEAIDRLEELLLDSTKKRMISDVPLGVFLSGGIDSSTITALMQVQSDRPVKTFSIGFNENGYDEAGHAKAISNHLGTDHTELYVTPKEAREVIPLLPKVYDEPFSDSSQIPTYLVSKLAKKDVTVALTGDGGDELFCGYNRYILGYEIWKKLNILPTSLMGSASWACAHFPAEIFEQAQKYLPRKMQIPRLSDRLPKLAKVLACKNKEAFYRELISHFKNPSDIVLGASEPDTVLSRSDIIPGYIKDFREQMMYLDMITYLPDDLLTKVDRASMALSLEARIPMLDHRIIEFAWTLPLDFKYRNGTGKWLLKQVLYRHVPKKLIDRPKMGFGVPIDRWLRGSLRDWAEDLLDKKRMDEDGFFDSDIIRKMWDEHTSGSRSWHYHLWDILMFQAWLRTK